MPDPDVGLFRVARYAKREAALVFFSARDGSPVLTAPGLWDEWKNRETGERLKSCTMIITGPSEFVSELHDRMPALLMEEQFDPWLSGKAGVEYLKPAPNCSPIGHQLIY